MSAARVGGWVAAVLLVPLLATAQPGLGAASDGGTDAAPKAGAPADADAAESSRLEASRRAACAQGLGTLAVDAGADDACSRLGDELYVRYAEASAAKLADSASVPALPQLSGTFGSAGQTSAVPSTDISPLAGVTGSLVGTETGTKTLTEITLNPFTLLNADDADKTTWGSRAGDVTVLLPVEHSASLGDIAYVGVRVRLNLLGFGSSRALREQLGQSYRALWKQSEVLSQGIDQALETSTTPETCIPALVAGEAPGEVRDKCGAVVDARALDEFERDFRGRVEALRREVDRRYLGLDLRYDHGDPRFSGFAERRGARLLAAVAAAQRLDPVDKPNQYLQLRARVGAAYTYLDALRTTDYSLDAAVAMEVGSQMEGGLVRFSFGGEGRFFGKTSTQESRYLDLVLGLVVPFGTGAGIGLGLTLPLVSPPGAARTATLGINGDLEYVLPLRL